MSDLQLALIALGVVIIAGVLVFNWWQERRFMQESLQRFEGPADDALMQDFRIDPDLIETESFVVEEVFDRPIDVRDQPEAVAPWLQQEADAPVAMPPAPEAEPEPVATVIETSAQPVHAAAAEPAATEPVVAEPVAEPDPQDVTDTQAAGMDETIDLIALLQAEAGVSAAAVQQAWQAMPKLDKPVHCHGLSSTGEWLPIAAAQPDTHFALIACALQLADRSGPVSRATLDSFEVEMENLATSLDASLQWQGAADPLGYAAELDRFCVDVDVMVGFHIMHGANGPIAGTKLRGLAEAQGMTLQDEGAFHYADDAGTTLFTMVSQDQRPFRPETLRTVFYRGVSFQMDVPRVSRCTDAFNQMVLLARQLEISLEGALVDDNQRSLGNTEIGKIRQQLDLIQARMVERGILPGTPTALRLFS